MVGGVSQVMGRLERNLKYRAEGFGIDPGEMESQGKNEGRWIG